MEEVIRRMQELPHAHEEAVTADHPTMLEDKADWEHKLAKTLSAMQQTILQARADLEARLESESPQTISAENNVPTNGR
jgi:hypothetical protein